MFYPKISKLLIGRNAGNSVLFQSTNTFSLCLYCLSDTIIQSSEITTDSRLFRFRNKTYSSSLIIYFLFNYKEQS